MFRANLAAAAEPHLTLRFCGGLSLLIAISSSGQARPSETIATKCPSLATMNRQVWSRRWDEPGFDRQLRDFASKVSRERAGLTEPTIEISPPLGRAGTVRLLLVGTFQNLERYDYTLYEVVVACRSNGYHECGSFGFDARTPDFPQTVDIFTARDGTALLVGDALYRNHHLAHLEMNYLISGDGQVSPCW